MNLGTNLSRLRTQNGLSQDALAELLGVSRQSVSKWETDSSVPELDKLVRLAEIFHVSLDELVRDMPAQDQTQTQTQIQPQAQVQCQAQPEAPTSPQAQAQPQTQAAEDVPPPVPEGQAAAAQGISMRQIVGIALLCVGFLETLLLTVFGGADGLLEGLFLALPLVGCGAICLRCRRRVGLWCGWTVFAGVDLYLRMSTSANWSLVWSALRYPDIYSEMPAQMLIAWIELSVLALLAVLTLGAFRRLRLPRDPRTVLLLAAGWAVRLAALPALKTAVVRWMLRNAVTSIPFRALPALCSQMQTALTIALAVCTVAVLRRRPEK